MNNIQFFEEQTQLIKNFIQNYTSTITQGEIIVDSCFDLNKFNAIINYFPLITEWKVVLTTNTPINIDDLPKTKIIIDNNTKYRKWNSQSIENYLRDLLSIVNNNINNEDFLWSIFYGDEEYSIKIENIKIFDCQKTIHIRLSDMALLPDRHLTDPSLISGHFVLDDKNNIIDFKGHSIQVFFAIKNINSNFLPRCYYCPIKNICCRGKLNQQFDTFGQLFIPINDVCDMLLNKYLFLLRYYNNTGILEIARNNNIIKVEDYDFYTETLKALDSIKN